MPITYSFTTAASELRSLVETGVARLDRVAESHPALTLAIANRVPAPQIQAQLESSKAEPYALSEGLQLLLYTPSSAYASISGEPFAIEDGDTLQIRIDNGYVQDIIFSGLTAGAATAEQMARSLAAQLRLADAELLPSEAGLSLRSRTAGSSSSIQFVGGTVVVKLSLSTTATYGSAGLETVTFTAAQFVNIAAATVAELVTVIDAASSRVTPRASIKGNCIQLLTAERKLSCGGFAAHILGLAPWAQAVSGNTEPFAIPEGGTLVLRIDRGAEQTITFESNPIADLSQVSAEYLAGILNTQLQGATAEVTPNGQAVSIQSNVETVNSCVEIIGGAANDGDGLGFTLQEEWGIGSASEVLYQAKTTDPIQFDLFNWGAGTFTEIDVRVTTNYATTLVYRLAPPYLASSWTATLTPLLSPGEIAADNVRLTLNHTNPFVSDEIVRVDVAAKNPLYLDQLNESYYFVIEDARIPWVVSAIPRTTKSLRLKYNEPMLQGDSIGSALYAREVSGRITYYASILIDSVLYYNVLEAPTTEFLAEEVGLFIGSAGAQNALNNFVATITAILPNEDGAYTRVVVNTSLVNERPALSGEQEELPPRVIVAAYKLDRANSLDEFTPAFIPILEQAIALDSTEVPVGDEAARYVDLSFHTTLSPSIPYILRIANACDLMGNSLTTAFTFTSWNLRNVLLRDWDLRKELPQYNWDNDKTGDLLKLINCFNEVAQILLHGVDTFFDLFDPWSTPEVALDALLAHIGNPFAFAYDLPVVKKRALAAILPNIYRVKGSDQSIEDIARFFIGKEVTVLPWAGNSDAWVLGESELGLNTYLDPSRSFIRYSFILQHSEALTDSEKEMLNKIVDFARPAHTHFIGYQKVD